MAVNWGSGCLPILPRGQWLAQRIGRAQTLLPDVAGIVAAVQARGDAALRACTLRYDGVDLAGRPLRVGPEELRAAAGACPPGLRADLEEAYRRLLAFHGSLELLPHELPAAQGVRLRLMVEPLRRVGIYAPAGRAPLFSSVLMAAAAARSAGVREIALASPPGKDGGVAPALLLAAQVAGISEIYRVGGAQAIAALAYGTEEIGAVDKIAGPGNRYVAAAKKAVYGTVDVDLIAGPSELLVVADESADPRLVALDLLAQAEHDPDAELALLALDRRVARNVARETAAALPPDGPARESIARAAACVADDIEEAVISADAWAPEHLELHLTEPGPFVRGVRAGSVFLGPRTPTALGDYVAGPTHVLPTGRSARALSGLSRLHFLRTFSVTEADVVDPGLFGLASRLADLEGLPLHALSLRERMRQAPGAAARAWATLEGGRPVGEEP